MKIAFVLLLAILLLELCAGHFQYHRPGYGRGRHRSPLKDYVRAYDPTFEYEHVSTIEGEGYTAYVMDLTSQTWLTAEDSTRSVWKHWVTICVPDDIDQTETGNILIDSGNEFESAPTELRPRSLDLCLGTKSIIATIRQIPNQPITFFADPKNASRVEDAIIAFTWAHFLEDPTQPNWLLRFPMTKAVVKCMDMVQRFAHNNYPRPRDFVVIGASKRGWTAWTVGAVDRRVKALVPIVIPILNNVENFNHLYRALGEWSFVLGDYIEENILEHLNEPIFEEMTNIIDPLSYNRKLRMPKYILCSTNDEFFLPDSTRFFYDQLKGDNHLRVVPNVGHGMQGALEDVNSGIATWIYMINHDIDFPEYSWSMQRSNATSGSITLVSNTPPSSVKVFVGSNSVRDFRTITCWDPPSCYNNPQWASSDLTPEADGITYIAEVPVPAEGYTGFLVEVQYAVPNGGSPLKFSSEVNILPDIWPFDGPTV